MKSVFSLRVDVVDVAEKKRVARDRSSERVRGCRFSDPCTLHQRPDLRRHDVILASLLLYVPSA